MRANIIRIIWYYLVFAVILGSSVAQVLITVAWVDLYSYQEQIIELLLSSFTVVPFSLVSGLAWPFTIFAGIYAVLLSAGTGYIPDTWIAPLFHFFFTIILIAVLFVVNKFISKTDEIRKYDILLLTTFGGFSVFIQIITLSPVSLVIGNNLPFLVGIIAIILINFGFIVKLGEHKAIFSFDSPEVHPAVKILLFGLYCILSTGSIGLILILDPTMNHSYLILSLFWYFSGFSIIFLIFRLIKLIKLSNTKNKEM